MKDARDLLNEMVEQQKGKLLQLAREVVPGITADDLFQPFDYPELESSVHFRYEEGILEGIQMVRAALLSLTPPQVKTGALFHFEFPDEQRPSNGN